MKAPVYGLALLSVLLLPMTSPVSSPRRSLQLSVSPRVAIGPVDIHASVRVAPDERNRALVIEVASDVGPTFGTAKQLEGQYADPQHTFLYRHLSAGEYEITACLEQTTGSVCAGSESVSIR